MSPQLQVVTGPAPAAAKTPQPDFGRPRRAAEGAGSTWWVQAKLAVGDAADPCEQEADRVAERVTATGPSPVTRTEAPTVRRLAHPRAGRMAAPPGVERVLARPGTPLPSQLRNQFEPRLGHDFSQVRVHTDGPAAASARAVNALAYTAGNHIVFGEGSYQPGSAHGRRLIAHELTHVLQQSGLGHIAAGILQRDAVELGVQFNRALAAGDDESAVRALMQMPPADARSALSALDTGIRARLRAEALRLDPAESNPVAGLIDSVEHAAAGPVERRAAPSPPEVAAATDIASLSGTEKLSRAWGYASERLGPEVRREVQHLFSRESLLAMAAFATLYIASQLTPAGWVADALVLTMLTVTVVFVGLAALDIARDLWRFFAAINARSDADLRTAGQALARAIARGGVAVFIALLSRTLPRGGPPPSGAAAAEAVAVGPGGLRMRVAVAAAEEVPAAIPASLSGLSYAVMVPPPGGGGSSGSSEGGSSAGSGRTSGSSGGSSRGSSGGSSGSPGRPRGPEIWGELSTELGTDAAGTGAARGGGVRGAVADARAGGLIGPEGRPGAADLAVQPHGSAPAARSGLGTTGAAAESAHIAPSSAVRGVTGYSRGGALTTLLDPATHAAFDAQWQRWAMAQRRAGRTTCTGAELERVMIDALANTPGLAQRVRNTLSWRMQQELRELGIRPDSTVTLPYPNIPASTP